MNHTADFVPIRRIGAGSPRSTVKLKLLLMKQTKLRAPKVFPGPLGAGIRPMADTGLRHGRANHAVLSIKTLR